MWVWSCLAQNSSGTNTVTYRVHLLCKGVSFWMVAGMVGWLEVDEKLWETLGYRG